MLMSSYLFIYLCIYLLFKIHTDAPSEVTGGATSATFQHLDPSWRGLSEALLCPYAV